MRNVRIEMLIALGPLILISAPSAVTKVQVRLQVEYLLSVAVSLTRKTEPNGRPLLELLGFV